MEKAASALLLVIISFLMYKDFFPEGETYALSFAIFVYCAYLLCHYMLGRVPSLSKEVKDIISQALLTVYFVLLIFVFTILNGKSSVGISFNNIFFWLVLLLVIIELISRWRKVERAIN